MKLLFTIFVIFSSLAFSQDSINEALWKYSLFLNSIQSDPQYLQLKIEESKIVQLYNYRENAGAEVISFKKLNQLMADLNTKYEDDLHLLRFVFAQEFPREVLSELPDGESGVSFILWKGNSRLNQAFNINLLFPLIQPHIRGHRITNYRAFDIVASDFLKGLVWTEFESLISEIETDELYRQLTTEERRVVTIYNERELLGSERLSFTRLNELKHEFAVKYQDRMDRLSFSFSKAFPQDVDRIFSGNTPGDVSVSWKLKSSMFEIFKVDLFHVGTQPHISGHRFLNYRPYALRARDQIRIEGARWKQKSQLGCVELLVQSSGPR